MLDHPYLRLTYNKTTESRCSWSATSARLRQFSRSWKDLRKEQKESEKMIFLWFNKSCVAPFTARALDTVQDFLIKLGIKPCLHILKISIFSLNHVIVRPTKIIKQPLQSLQNLYFQSNFLASEINRIFRNFFFFCKEYLTRRSTFINEIFWKLEF